MEEEQGVLEAEPTTLSENPTDETNLEVESQPNEVEGEGSDEPTAEATVDSEDTESGKRPNRLERRFQKMSQKMRDLTNENQQLRGTGIPPASQAPYPQYQPGQEVSLDQYQQDVVNTASAIAQLEAQKLRQEITAKERVENFDRDVMLIEQRYPQLNVDSPEYDAKLSEKVANMYEKLSAKSADLRLRDIVEDVMDVATRQTASSTAKVTKQVAQQAAETAVRPGANDKPPVKSFEEKSLADMEKELGFAKR